MNDSSRDQLDTAAKPQTFLKHESQARSHILRVPLIGMSRDPDTGLSLVGSARIVASDWSRVPGDEA